MDEAKQAELSVARTALAEAMKGEAQARYLHRLHCVMLVLLGHDPGRVATWYGNDRTTVARWVRIFRADGAESLRDNPRSGRPPALEPEQWRALADAVRRPPREAGLAGTRWTGERVAGFLKTRFRVRLGLRQCQRLLTQLRRHPARVGGPAGSNPPDGRGPAPRPERGTSTVLDARSAVKGQD